MALYVAGFVLGLKPGPWVNNVLKWGGGGGAEDRAGKGQKGREKAQSDRLI
jgi:hypothetical protein